MTFILFQMGSYKNIAVQKSKFFVIQHLKSTLCNAVLWRQFIGLMMRLLPHICNPSRSTFARWWFLVHSPHKYARTWMGTSLTAMGKVKYSMNSCRFVDHLETFIGEGSFICVDVKKVALAVHNRRVSDEKAVRVVRHLGVFISGYSSCQLHYVSVVWSR